MYGAVQKLIDPSFSFTEMAQKISVTEYLLYTLDNRDRIKADLKSKFEAVHLGDPDEAKRQLKIAMEAIR